MRAIPVDWTRDMVVHEEVSDQPILPFGNGLQDIKVARNCLVLIPSKHTARWQMASDGGTIDKFPIGTDFAVEDSVQAVVCDSDAMVLEVVDLVLADYRGTEKFCDGRTLCTDSWDSGGSSSRSRSSGHHTERSSQFRSELSFKFVREVSKKGELPNLDFILADAIHSPVLHTADFIRVCRNCMSTVRRFPLGCSAAVDEGQERQHCGYFFVLGSPLTAPDFDILHSAKNRA